MESMGAGSVEGLGVSANIFVGMGAIAPERRNKIVNLGVRSIIAGTIATCMTGAVVGIIY